MRPTLRDVHIPSTINQPKRKVQKPWTATTVPDNLKGWSFEMRKRFSQVANRVLAETGDEEKAVQAGIAAAMELEKANHAKNLCMICKVYPPTIDVLWNDGRGRAWFCKGCGIGWLEKNKTSVVYINYIDNGIVPKRFRQMRHSPKETKKGTQEGRIIKKVDINTQLLVNGKQVSLRILAKTWLIKQAEQSEREKLKVVQQSRAKKYGITARDDGALTIPRRFADLGATEADFADPVNYKFPVWLSQSPDNISPEKLGMVRNAPVRFSQFASNYDSKSRSVVRDRIERALKRFKVGEYREEEKGLVQKLWQATIIEKSQEKQLAYGLILRPDVADAQGDIYNAEEVEKAAHWYAANSFNKTDWQHETELPHNQAVLVESFIAPVGFDWNEFEVKKGDWLGAVWIQDKDKWQAVKKGEVQAFSIKGQGRRMAL